MTVQRKRPDEPVESPIAFSACSNGEYAPRPVEERDRRALQLFRELVEQKHKRAGLSRRAFAESACGVATALLVINQVYGCSGSSSAGKGPRTPARDAGFGVTPPMTEDAQIACATVLSPDTFVFDVQLHPPNPLAPWTDRPLPMDAETFVRTAFIESETSAGVLSGVPDTRNLNQPNLAANHMLQELIDRYAGPRLICHANLDPSRGASELDYMQDVYERFPIAAWKVYPHVGPWRLDSQEHGLPFLERSRELGVKVIAAHRGIADDSGDYAAPSSPADLVRAARAFSDLQFLTYHSGWQQNVDENHPFDPAQANPRGVDRLVKSVLDEGIGPNGNVYAELGTTWRSLMTRPEQAAHVLGKLLKYVGEDRVVWGTDSVFTGSPQEQITALRMFEIPLAMQEAYGYPALTDAVKRKIFGLNAAKVYRLDPAAVRCEIADDFISQQKTALRHDPRALPPLRAREFGPRTRREFLAFCRFERHLHGA